MRFRCKGDQIVGIYYDTLIVNKYLMAVDKVAQKSSTFLIGRQEAETEVFTDLAVKKTGSVDKALLFVVSKVKMEAKVRLYVCNLSIKFNPFDDF